MITHDLKDIDNKSFIGYYTTLKNKMILYRMKCIYIIYQSMCSINMKVKNAFESGPV